MASSFGARRSENVDALFTQAVESFVGVDAGEENLSIAHNYCLYHAKHHSFPDTDPRKVRGALDALRERLGIHAQLDKQRALDMLVGRFERRPWPADVPDVHARVLQLLLGLSRNPLQSKYTHIDAAAAVGEDDGVGATRDRLAGLDGDHADLLAALRGAGAGGAPGEFDDDDDERSDSDSDSDLAAAHDGRSDSTLSDWTDDEAEDARVGALRRDVAAAADAARRDARATAPRADRGAHLAPTEPPPTPADDPGFSWSRLGETWDDDDDAPRDDENDRDDAWEWDDPAAAAIAAAAAAARRNGGGEAAASAASRLYPALVAARARVPAATLPGSRRLGTEARAVGDALHALQGHADPRAAPSSVPHLSPAALEGALSRAREAAAALEAAASIADVVLDPARSAVANGAGTTGPTTRACATAVLGMTRECRESLAPMLQRAAGTGGGTGAPTLLELRARVSATAERARALASLARAALPAPRDGATPSAAASRCLTALARAAAAWQTSPGVGAGFVVATRLLCASAQPYLAATHAWIETGTLDDPAGEFFVRAGEARGAKIGTEAHWERGFELRRGRLGEPECPEFFAACVEELLAAGKAAQLMRAEDRPGWIAGEGTEATDAPGEGDAGTFPPARRHLCVEFCRRTRAALETGAAFRDDEEKDGDEDGEDDDAGGYETDDAAEDDDESVGMLRGTSLEAFPSRPGVASSSRDSAFAPTEETATLLACGLAGSTTRVAAFVGERAEWGGVPFRRSAAATAAARLDAWLSSSEETLASASCPIGATLAAAAAAPARARAAAVGAALMVRLRGRWRLRRCLESLRAVYLGGAGEATASFSAAVFRRLDAGDDDPLDAAELNVALAEAIAADESGNLPDARDVSVEVTSGGSAPRSAPSRASAETVAGEGAARLAELARIRVRVRVPWPLTLVIPESSLERYADAGAFLMQLRAARAALEETATSGWSAAARRAPGGGGGGGFHARRLAAECRHFVAALHEHVATRVLHASWADLVAAMERAETPNEAREAHAAFLDGACRQCLASPDPTWTLLAGQVRAALAAACDLAAARRRAAAEAAAAAQDADPAVGRSVVGTWGAANAAAAAEAAALAGYRPVPEAEAERLASAFRRARSYVLRVVESKLKIGSFPELAELRLRLDFNGFYGTKDRGGVGEE